MGLNDPSKKASILRVVDVIVVRWRPDRMCDPFCEGQGSGDCSSCSGLRQRTCKTGNHTWCFRSTSRQGRDVGSRELTTTTRRIAANVAEFPVIR